MPQVFQPATRALAVVQTYRHPTANGRSPSETVLTAIKTPQDKTGFFAEGLMPNVSEWKRLDTDYPNEALALRRLQSDWLGLLDPCFRVTFSNSTDQPVTVQRIEYSATLDGGVLGELIGGFETARYLFELPGGPGACG